MRTVLSSSSSLADHKQGKHSQITLVCECGKTKNGGQLKTAIAFFVKIRSNIS